MQQVSEKNSQWVGHVCCAQGVIRALEQQSYKSGSDASVVLGWAVYYDVLARFSLRHWRTAAIRHIAAELGFDPKGSKFCAVQFLLARSSFATQLSHVWIHAHPILGLLSEVCNTSLSSADPNYHQEEYQSSIDDLASRLERLPMSMPRPHTSLQALDDVVPIGLELFRLAALIYLERVSKNFSGQSRKLDHWTSQGFVILDGLDTCRWPFPLFVLACEARTDVQRMMILGLFARSLKKPHLPHLQMVKALIQTVWVQDDLEVDGDVEYIRKLNLVLSSNNVVPSFV
jgi:hypothetical protein